MNASVWSATWWTPERGALEADDTVRALRRWSRVLVSVVEDVVFSLPTDVCVVVATRTGAADLEHDLEALRGRWPQWQFVAVHAEGDTVPLALAEAIGCCSRYTAVVCATVELTPAAELGTALWLRAQPGGCRLHVAHERSGAATSAHVPERIAEALNPCAAALELVRGIETAAVSIRVGSWGIHVSSPVPYR